MTSEPWPALPDELSERLMLDHDGFVAFLRGLAGSFGSRAFAPAHFEHAIGYPWPRPAESFVLRDGAVEPWQPDATEGRLALLAIGSNAAPERLTAKLAHFESPEDRLVPVQTGMLADFDVGAAPVITGYGAMPATLFESPGTNVATAILWVTDTQFTQLTWSEFGYWLGRLNGVRFNDETLTVYVFVHRLGTFAPDGEPIALDAITAEHRTAPAWTQRAFLDRAAVLVGLPDAEAVVEQVFLDAGTFLPRAAVLREYAQPFANNGWTPFTWNRAPGSPADPATAP